jgi:hypothetical protein
MKMMVFELIEMTYDEGAQRRLAPKVIFLRKSQVKSPKSQVMTLTFLKKIKKSKS